MKAPNHTFTEQEVLTILRNMGHDVECGACMAIAFTGTKLPGDKHTCAQPSNERERAVWAAAYGASIAATAGSLVNHGEAAEAAAKRAVAELRLASSYL